MKILPILLLFGWSAMLIAQEDITFTASLSSDTVNLEQPFEITFTISGKEAQNFEQPDFQGFEVVYGPNQSTQMSVVNGSMSQKRSYSFGLQALDVGTHVISPASITVNGTVIKTDFIKVVADENYIPKRRKRGRDNFFDQFQLDFSFPDMEGFPRRRKNDGTNPEPTQPTKKGKKKRKVYKI